MNKREAIKRIEQMREYERFVDEPISKASVLNIVSQINEPQKVVIPQFVAEWAENTKKQNFPLRQALEHWSMSEELEKWFQYSYNQETFARAWLDGYEVKKERLYTVEIPNTNDDSLTVLEFISNSCIVLSQMESFPDNWKEMDIYQLTESEIRQDFEWAWDAGFAKEVE